MPNLLDVEAARGAEIFGQPEDEKIPGPVAQELGEDQTPDLPIAEQIPVWKAAFPPILDDGVLKVLPFGAGDKPMPSRLVVQFPPGPGPDKPDESGRRKDPAPVAQRNNQRDQRRRNHRADARSAVEDTERAREVSGIEDIVPDKFE